ncbi:MAG TPA: imidazolonepropionase [Vicinamibacterales bacterium]|nr:imidazolonepropionase [Vicinamibacterales bacterium]
MLADFVLRGAGQVLTCAGPAPRRGSRQDDASPVPGGAVAAFRGTIVFVGPTAECDRAVTPAPGAIVLDAAGRAVVPGFVDPHTHVVFAGDRREELRRRLAGATYAEIAAAGGGILSTVRATRDASEDDLVASALPRLAEMLACGTTTAEVKSGYGLETGAEIRMLRAIRALGERQPVDLVPTFLGAHEMPAEHRARRQGYLDVLVSEMIPAVAGLGLAEWCDVFCETGVFTPVESREILRAGQAAGLKARIHADEMGASGGSDVAADVGARSADHLLFVEPASAEAMARAGVVATLLPAAAFYLKLGRFAPARMLIERGVAVALATDVNPGGGFTPSMPFVVALACFGMGMTLEESLVAATINAAYAIDRHESVGSLEAGKKMDAVVVAGSAVDLLRVGAPSVAAVIKGGRVVSGSLPRAS